MPRRKPPTTEDALLDALEKEVLKALQLDDITIKERADFVAKGTQLLLIRHKIKPAEEEGSFFQ